MAEDTPSGHAWQGRRPRLAAVALVCALGLACAALALTALPVAFGDTDASASTEDRLDTVFDQTIGKQLQQYGAGGITGRTNIASVRPYTNPSDEVQFRVDAEKPAYWRTGGYDVFTGKQWHRSSDYQPYQMDDPPGEDRRRSQTYTVEMETATDRLPAAWRPVNVDGNGQTVTYDTQGGLKTETFVGRGDTFTVESEPPVDDPAVLRAAGTEYPGRIEQRYTALPNSVSDRVNERAATVTADSETPYDAAIAVKQYLRSNKGYTLDVPPPDQDVASELLFDLDAAHCAYFATTMATMLRSQDIPTRYAVGYTTGDRIDGEYVVRDANAHAWVEVFFPEVGWVPFDPTPPDGRTTAVADSLENVSNGDLGAVGDIRNRGDRSDDTSDDGDDTDDPFDPNPDDPDRDPDGLQIAVASQPLPGQTLAISVLEDGRSRRGITVLFNGEPAGQTNARGTVVGTVPYASELDITARTPAESDRQPARARRTLALPTEIELAVDGHPIAGTDATVTATLGGTPVPDARLTREGDLVATTDEDGSATIPLPAEPGTELTLAASRGAASGSTNVTTVDVSVSVAGTPVVLPGRPVTVTASAGDEPLANEPVSLDGQQLATENGTPVRTDANGTATITAPPSFGATVAVGNTGATRINPVLNLIGLLGGGVLVGAMLLGGWLLRRSGSKRRSLSGVVLDRALALADRVGAAGDSGAITGPIQRLLAPVRDRLRGGGTTQNRQPVHMLDGYDSAGPVRRGWLQLLALVPGVSPTQTPRSIADRAIDLGLPRRPVERVLTAFRRAEYGGNTGTEEETRGVQEALEELSASDGEVTDS